MKKIVGFSTALALVTIVAFSGCQQQEQQPREGQPGSAPTQTQQPAAPESK